MSGYSISGLKKIGLIVNSQELLDKAIQECKEYNNEKQIKEQYYEIYNSIRF